MENHPIPQDVTGFKFRLIGSITLKQFLYLLGAGILALIFYLLPLPIFLKVPLMIIPAIIGLMLAFVPIDGRPMDRMIMNFLKALPAENEYIYRKKGAEMSFFNFNPPTQMAHVSTAAPLQNSTQKAVLFNQLSKTYFKPDKEEQEGISNISSLFQEGTAPNQGFTNRVIQADQSAPTAPAPIPANPIKEEAAPVMAKPHIPEPVAPTPTPPAPTPTQAEPQATATPAVNTPTATAFTTPANFQPASTGGASSTDVPNILTGIVKAPGGKPLPHIIVEVLDTHGTAVRAFRTNQAGIFAAATPLPSGTYTIHLEDALKKMNFTDVVVTLSGSVIEPVIITSIDPREQLRKELFG